MTPVASATAWVLHDLGLATGFGGSLFGKVALRPAVGEISQPDERGKVMEAAWKGFNVFNMVSLAAIAGTWIAGRAMLSGGEIDKSTRAFVIAKDVLVGTAVLTGLGAAGGGMLLARSDKGDAPALNASGEPAPQADEKAKVIHGVVDALGYVNLAAIAGVIGLTAILAMKSSSSHKFGFISRFLP